MPEFERRERPVEAPNDFHCPVTLVLDVSGSMNIPTKSGKSRIQEVNDGINRMMEDMKNDLKLGSIVDLSIITFGDPGAEGVYQEFCAVKDIKPVELTAESSSTHAVKALQLAMENTRSRRKSYGVPPYKPWVVLVTDGELHDTEAEIDALAAEVDEQEKAGKLHVWCFGTPDFNPNQLGKFSHFVFEIVNYNFADFFAWMANSIASMSNAVVPGQTVDIMTDPGVIRQVPITVTT